MDDETLNKRLKELANVPVKPVMGIDELIEAGRNSEGDVACNPVHILFLLARGAQPETMNKKIGDCYKHSVIYEDKRYVTTTSIAMDELASIAKEYALPIKGRENGLIS
ncbi:MAG: hypothetical protein AABX08_02545 [Nanoarchaeota archaeon]